MKNKTTLGNKGEAIAAKYLIAEGYVIVERNWRHKRSEIDLICKKENTLVFVEVKTRSSTAFGEPEDAVDEKKAAKVIEGAEEYIFRYDWSYEIRFDIVSVLIEKNRHKILHLQDAFY